MKNVSPHAISGAPFLREAMTVSTPLKVVLTYSRIDDSSNYSPFRKDETNRKQSARFTPLVFE
jgi:hypothetical protein